MKQTIIFSLTLLSLILSGCSNKKQEELMADIKAAVDSCDYSRLAKVYPNADSLGINFERCTISFDSVNIKEENETLTLPATIVQKRDSLSDTLSVKFIAKENKEGKFEIVDTKGLYLFSSKYPLAAVAVGSGAVDGNKGDAEVFKFVQDSTNSENIKEMVAKLKDNMFEYGKFEFTRNKERNKYEGNMFYSSKSYYKATLTNNTNFTFSKAKLTIKLSVYFEGRFDYPGYSGKITKYINITEIKPGDNDVYYAVTSTAYDIGYDPVIVGISGIPENEINEAMKTYKYSGKEYSEFLQKK